MSEVKLTRPMLLANDEAGHIIDWTTRIKDPGNWMYSIKDDGVRIEMFNSGPALGRSLKPIASVFIQGMLDRFRKLYKWNGVLEAEIYGEGLTLPETIHFTRCKNVEDPKYMKKWTALWKKTQMGTVTYKKTVKGEVVDAEWPFPGRTPEWLCTWPRDMHFQIFGCFPYSDPMATMEERYEYLKRVNIITDKTQPWKVVIQKELKSLAELDSEFGKTQLLDREGLVVMHRGASYKQGRVTLNDGIGYKYKETNIEFDCTILDVVEATVARPGAPKTINELGRSVTSKLAEDREKSGMAKGFYVLLSDGQKMTVSLNGYTHPMRKKLLENKSAFIGRVITCTGGKPVKLGGKPRSSHYTLGYKKRGI